MRQTEVGKEILRKTVHKMEGSEQNRNIQGMKENQSTAYTKSI